MKTEKSSRAGKRRQPERPFVAAKRAALRQRTLAAHVEAVAGVPIVKSITPGNLPNVPIVRAEPSALNELRNRGYSAEELFDLVVPKRTLARRQAQKEPLTVEETDKALRLERIASLAEAVFGEKEKAHRWLRKPKSSLEGATPLAFLASEAGSRVVEDMLLRIEHGIFA